MSKGIIAFFVLAAALVPTAHAQLTSGSYSQDDLTDAVKQRAVAAMRRLLVATVRPQYRELMEARFDWFGRNPYRLKWSLHEVGRLFAHGSLDVGHIEYWMGREALRECSIADPIGAIYDKTVEYGPNDLLTPDEAKAHLERAMREVLVPEPWSVEVTFDEGLSKAFDTPNGPLKYVFEYAARYRGYVFDGGSHSQIEVDPLSGCIVRLAIHSAGFPLVDPEDVPILSRERVAALGQVALDAYARHRPLATAEAGRAVALLTMPHFQNRPNAMTLRHRLRSDLLMPILVVERQFLGRDAQGRLWMQEFSVDPIRGVPLAVNEYPLDGWAPLGSGGPAPLRLDPAEGRWTLADGSAVGARKVQTPRDPKDDGTVVLFDDQGRTASFRLDASRRLLWTEGPSRREAWSVSRGDAERLVRLVRETLPSFPPVTKADG
ncbi:MAG: hypothetical protein KIS66_05560 [Fimbriimonadaceae bacterium]|nr:hypothetical protein [Fimbriimonadaceae bacterium]